MALQKTKSSTSSLNFGLQDFMLRKQFPTFKLYKKNKEQYWIGTLKPTENSTIYKIKVLYHPFTPKVYVLYPRILKHAPHRYHDKSLCLYHPNDRSFKGTDLFSNTIIPWTCEWLFFYESWLDEGIWWGKEAPHDIRGIHEQK